MNEVPLFETKRLPMDRIQEMIPVLKAFLDYLSRVVLDLNLISEPKIPTHISRGKQSPRE